MEKMLDFEAKISDVEQINPLFSTCRVRVLYTGRNRNLSSISKEAVTKALPTIKNIPIVGEYSFENEDYKGHGGAIDLSSYKYIHTTKPYGVVPESATYEWEEVKGRDGITREYLVINGAYLWTGRYEEALDVVEKGKGQSMEIQVTNGEWVEESNDEYYRIDNFVFSALCILGDDVEPAFENASITSYSLNDDSFKQEFSKMLDELKTMSNESEESVMLKELLEKYNLTVEQLTEKGIDFNEISEDELEAKIIEAFEIETVEEEVVEEEEITEEKTAEEEVVEEETTEEEVISKEEFTTLQSEMESLQGNYDKLLEEVETLREYKLNQEKESHKNKVEKLFKDFQLDEEDVKDLDIHKFSIEEIEEKCYAILGRKLSKNTESKSLRFEIEDNEEDKNDPYGGLHKRFLK